MTSIPKGSGVGTGVGCGVCCGGADVSVGDGVGSSVIAGCTPHEVNTTVKIRIMLIEIIFFIGSAFLS
jgi:hypothetical protein